MTDLHQVAPPGAPAGQRIVDLQWFRVELEQLRRLRLEPGHGSAEPSHAAVALQVSPPTQHPASAVPDIVEVWGLDSFPASDPPANW